MVFPYSDQPLRAFLIAQACLALVLSALVWQRPLSTRISTGLFLLAVWSSVLSLLAPLGAACAALAMVLEKRRALAFGTLLGLGCVLLLRVFLPDSEGELTAAQLALLGLVLGLHRRGEERAPETAGPLQATASQPIDDAALFAIAVLAALCAGFFALRFQTSSGDEVAYSFQAAALARGHAWSATPVCADAFRSTYLFDANGRRFSQYTPGWPLFLAPFAALHAAWLASPIAFGLLAVAAARLGRRGARGASSGTVRAAGILSALMLFGASALLNAGSRYSHIFLILCFAWAVETLCMLLDDARPGFPWPALVLGAASALMLASRPADGATLGVGLAVVLGFALLRSRVCLRALLPALLAFGLFVALTLVILRLQLGRFFATGYSLSTTFNPWDTSHVLALPRGEHLKWAIPLATGAFLWWPASPALGMAGLALLRGPARKLAVIFLAAYVPYFLFYALLQTTASSSFGYGPRYALAAILPMAVGSGVLLAPLFTSLRRGPAAVALLALFAGALLLGPLVYPRALAEVDGHNQLRPLLARTRPHRAVVLVDRSLADIDPRDTLENLPLELYPEQDVLIALDTPENLACLRRAFPERPILRPAAGGTLAPAR